MLLPSLFQILALASSIGFTLQQEEVMRTQIMIPLAYAYSSQQQKIPIVLSFSQSETYTPFPTNQLMLYSTNISMQTQYIPGTQNIIIGLKSPSTFIYAVKSLYGVSSNQIEFKMRPFIQLLINQNNFVESTDSFVNKASYDIDVKYNFGGGLTKNNQICELVDSELVKFDELLILEILNSMNKRNNIKFVQNVQSQSIELEGDIENFPKITIRKGKSIFEVTITGTTLFYIPHSSQISESRNIIGLKALQGFSKFSIDQQSNAISFKRTSQLYQLYIFLGYFFVFILMLIIVFHNSLQDSMKFIKNVLKWLIQEDNQARALVLRTELE